ncbi:hypothetical protein K431DRAFT_304942 [Polychaeton citri CBS 116435]|uniref:PLD phosphodiesterase domain-containing protein n=1 Tax=Polychaeton citri CBS 116435 TaxID=1314669 RepID=A0A9P4Q4I4_9PEZI|nr:hypothetical protein K431DRAFT_304942 [Polychaeton citri CBS 116435]
MDHTRPNNDQTTTRLLSDWHSRLSDPKSNNQNKRDNPNYWATDPSTLETTSHLHSLHFGTGHSIYAASILPAIARAESEVILVTCFWAPSPTLTALNGTLRALAARARSDGRTIRVRICFSSSSLWQKLTHTLSLQGQAWPPAKWARKLHLADPDELRGLDVEVKSVFVLPFSVMHPKFVLVDRRVAFLPSCNVSWERWFEGCVELSGPVVEQFVRFYLSFWEQAPVSSASTLPAPSLPPWQPQPPSHTRPAPLASRALPPLTSRHLPSLFLPSPHHLSPRPFLPPPPTPLNTFLLTTLLTSAHSTLYIQTPNLTSAPFLSALLAAMARGVDVSITTSEKLMVLEQLVTLFTTTKRCVARLVKAHRRLLQTPSPDVEAGRVRTGRLKIAYYQPSRGAGRRDGGGRHGMEDEEPVQSHLKLLLIDSHTAVFGSGNMDRASWYTSQELGVAIFSPDFVGTVTDSLEPIMEGRRRTVYDAPVSL